jgi:hypothetical protein
LELLFSTIIKEEELLEKIEDFRGSLKANAPKEDN